MCIFLLSEIYFYMKFRCHISVYVLTHAVRNKCILFLLIEMYIYVKLWDIELTFNSALVLLHKAADLSCFLCLFKLNKCKCHKCVRLMNVAHF